MSNVYVSGMENNPISFLARCADQINDVAVATYVTDIMLGSVDTPTIHEAIDAIESLGHKVSDVLHSTILCDEGFIDADDCDPDCRYEVTFVAVPTADRGSATVRLWGSEVIAFANDLASSGWWEIASIGKMYGSR